MTTSIKSRCNKTRPIREISPRLSFNNCPSPQSNCKDNSVPRCSISWLWWQDSAQASYRHLPQKIDIYPKKIDTLLNCSGLPFRHHGLHRRFPQQRRVNKTWRLQSSDLEQSATIYKFYNAVLVSNFSLFRLNKLSKVFLKVVQQTYL